ncbi:hypothetical protein C5D18_02065 [Rathayibacter tritici]|nr:hypothetical protein C5D18_02065 [Rathayibacter tritici]
MPLGGRGKVPRWVPWASVTVMASRFQVTWTVVLAWALPILTWVLATPMTPFAVTVLVAVPEV